MGVNIHLKFPAGISNSPVVCNMTRLFDLDFNITKAQISIKNDGFMVLELLGSTAKINEAISYLESQGVSVTPAAQRIKKNDEVCVECGMCTAICPPHALYMDEARHLVFDSQKCVVCGRCIKICPVRAIEADIEVLEHTN